MGKQLSWKQMPIETENSWPTPVRVMFQVGFFFCLFLMLVGVMLCLIVASTHQVNGVTNSFLSLGLRLVFYPIAAQLLAIIAAAVVSKVQYKKSLTESGAINNSLRNEGDGYEEFGSEEDRPY